MGTAQFPALQLCARSGQAYSAATMQEAAKPASSSAGNVGSMLGGILAVCGLLQIPFGMMKGGGFNLVIRAVLVVIRVVIAVRARTKGKHAAWLRANGVPLTARVVSAQPTGTRIQQRARVPLHAGSRRGRRESHPATFEKLVPEHQVAMLIGGEYPHSGEPV